MIRLKVKLFSFYLFEMLTMKLDTWTHQKRSKKVSLRSSIFDKTIYYKIFKLLKLRTAETALAMNALWFWKIVVTNSHVIESRLCQFKSQETLRISSTVAFILQIDNPIVVINNKYWVAGVIRNSRYLFFKLATCKWVNNEINFFDLILFFSSLKIISKSVLDCLRKSSHCLS